MSVLEFVLLGLALGTDSFSVSVGIGTNAPRWTTILKLSLLFSLTQVILFAGGSHIHWLLDGVVMLLSRWRRMSLAGMTAEQVVPWVSTVFSLVGAALLVGLGINMLMGAFRQESADSTPVYYTGRWGLLALAFSVSVDALTAGVGVGMFSEVNLWTGSVTLGVVIGVMALLGLALGRQINQFVGSRAEVVGGILLLALAVHFLLGSGVLD